MKKYSRLRAVIDLDAVMYNMEMMHANIEKETKMVVVIKTDGYGHGAVPISRMLEDVDYVWGYAVATLDEGVVLRKAGIQKPILCLGCIFPDQLEEMIRHEIRMTTYSYELAKLADETAYRMGKKAYLHIKIDTGMSRLGYLCDGDYFESGVEGICEGCTLPGLDAEGIFTHFAVSDEFGEEYESYTKHQFELFTSVIDEVEKKLGKKFKIRHCANTGAVARYPETWLDMVRPGLLLYGYGDFAQELGLKPVMSLKTTVSTIKTYPAGTAISYGGIYKTDRKTRMGVVPYGYADGYFRCLSNRYELMTEEGPAPQRGKICMDMCMIDLTDKMNVDVGSEVEIFGKANPIEHMAQLAGTIPYELTCAVSKRVPRMYIKDGKVYEKELLLRG